ncbi:hypothetical protein BS17DRAFT_816226 [Gyrodon lividus]|nr:hypothetical protein BS17DRAFT_816226 [Gyrodon lividus]
MRASLVDQAFKNLMQTMAASITYEREQTRNDEIATAKCGFTGSAVIENLLGNGLADDETLAYIYCDFRNPRCTGTMQILRSCIALVEKVDGSPDALSGAFAINRGSPALDSTIAPMHKTDILEICGSLVRFGEETDLIILSHHSVKEYLPSDATTDKTYFVHHPRASFELASLPINSIILTDQPNVDSHNVDLSHYVVFSGFGHLANCFSGNNDPLLGTCRTTSRSTVAAMLSGGYFSVG